MPDVEFAAAAKLNPPALATVIFDDGQPAGLLEVIAPAVIDVNVTGYGFGLVIVKVSVELPPARIGLDKNNFEMLGGFKTVRDEEAIPLVPLFVPPSVEETNPLTLS